MIVHRISAKTCEEKKGTKGEEEERESANVYEHDREEIGRACGGDSATRGRIYESRGEREKKKYIYSDEN